MSGDTERRLDPCFVVNELERRVAVGETSWDRTRAGAVYVVGHSFGAQMTQARSVSDTQALATCRAWGPQVFAALSPLLSVGVTLSPA